MRRNEGKKFIESKREGEYEIKKFHVRDVDEAIELKWICEKLWLYDEDGADAYSSYGLCFGWEGDIFCVNTSKFIDGIKKHVHDRQEDDDEFLTDDDVKKIFTNLEMMEKYRGYEIYPS